MIYVIHLNLKQQNFKVTHNKYNGENTETVIERNEP